MYCLQAVIAKETLLAELAVAIKDPHLVLLGQQLSLLPMTTAQFGTASASGAPPLGGFWVAPAAFGPTLAAVSANGPVAYVEADYFGGTGEQAAQVWEGGRAVLGPLHVAAREPFPVAGSPISQALRQLGVARGQHYDEFDAVGLGRHRDTQDWIRRPA